MNINFSSHIDSIKFLLDALSRLVGFLQDPKPTITLLDRAMIDLRRQSEDIQNKIRATERDGETQTLQIQGWFAEVAGIDATVSKILTDYKNGSFRWRIKRRAQHSLADVEALAKKPFLGDSTTTKLPPNGVQEIFGELPAANSMVSYLSQLQTHLQEDGSGVIGIWGMGGVGKTTLLRGLNDKILRGQSRLMFDQVIWAVASKDYKPLKLMHAIANWLDIKLSSDEFQQAREINRFLKNKSFLLLLDDLWQQVEFIELGIPQPRAGATKQKVVFTTRLDDVCGIMQVRHKIKIECLAEEEAWQFFAGKVGEETLQKHPRIRNLAREVAKECDGLPLALTVIGSTMRTKSTPKEWQNAITLLQKQPHEIDGMVDKILFKLKFSYDNMDNEIIKNCFLLCSLWPEDHSISKDDLIECWMGHGLVNEHKFDNINEAYDNGYALVGRLQAACLLEPGDNKGREVKMHDLIREMALWIASGCCENPGENPKRFIILSNAIDCENSHSEVERLSSVRSDLGDKFCLPVNCYKLKTLMVQESNFFKSFVTGFFEGTRTLTYLDLSNTAIYDLPQEIGLLGNLRYLNLSHTKVYSLPLQLGSLCELRFLLLREMGSISIPRGVLAKLVMLSVIDMTGTLCNNWQELSRLSRSLKGVGIILESIEDLHRLAQIHLSTWRLGLRKLQGLNVSLDLLSPLLLGSHNIRWNIQMLKIEACESLDLVLMNNHGDGINQKWYLPRLEKLELKSLPKLKEVFWRGVCPANMLPNLTVLTISVCRQLSNISWVIRLPSLEDLTVQQCIQMKQIIDDDREFAQAFPSLRRLRLAKLKSLIDFGGSFEFPSLELLQVIDCPKMNKLPFGAEMVGKKLKVIRGVREWWNELNMEDDARAALLPYFK